ncbi:MAG: iron-sulfur cluster insertion protein ErpA [Chlamydiia bacterium]|jgi:iron-sulfur cluster insertion protein|nr:iron-sulfur cluster insertion protein ErpA [Chlamydiia bacterium]
MREGIQANFSISEAAARQIRALASKDKLAKMLRITIKAGGCSGFQYFFDLDNHLALDDLTFEKDGAMVAIDPLSFGFIKEAQLDYIEELMGSYFALNNPNAQSSCGCGSSFSV